jgi:NRAMP (natural resistance-associated macrophage protein)-like metal ion transporter
MLQQQSSTGVEQPRREGIDARSQGKKPQPGGMLRAVGLGLITGAADDDPSAIGTYAAAGAALGLSLLWIAPVLFPMMFAVVYLSSKLGQVTGKGLFGVLNDHYPRRLLYTVLVGVLIGNVIEAGADIGGMAAAVGVLLPIPHEATAVGLAVLILALQFFGSYRVIRNVFRWLALALLAYIGSAIFARPDLGEVIRGTFIPTLHFDSASLAIVVAIVGTSLSAYLYTWQSNNEVEEEIAMGRTRLSQRIGATSAELEHSQRDILFGMFFSSLVMYFVMLATGATLFKSGQSELTSAADAAKALGPLAGDLDTLLFAVGLIGVGFLAVPVMTTGAAYSLAQTLGWKHGLFTKPGEAREFYAAIAVFTAIGVGLNFLGFNPMKMLVWSGIVQGFSTPPLMLLIMWMTNRRSIMREHVNGRAMNALGWVTTICIFTAAIALLVSLAL